MAFSLTGLKTIAERSEEAISSNFRQILVLKIAALASDVDLDIADEEGTFWTAVDTSPGSLGEKALKAIKDMKSGADRLVSVSSEEFITRRKINSGGTGAAGTYKIPSIVNHIPNIEFNTGEGPLAFEIRLEFDLQDGVTPLNL